MVQKKCICEICNCGRHVCKHKPASVLPRTDKPCTATEYTTRYKAYDIPPRESFKPPPARLPEGSIADRTTHRVDYVPYKWEKPWSRQLEPYKKPPGCMEGLTSYKKDYTEKHAPPVKSLRPDGTHPASGKFDGEPTYRSDYKKWDQTGRPPKFGIESEWKPPIKPFQGESTFTHDYRPYYEPPRKSLRPLAATNLSAAPMADNTGYRDDYIRHPLPLKMVRDLGQYKPPTIPVDGLTTFMRDYQGKQAQRIPSFKPDLSLPDSGLFQDMTTFRNDFRAWPTEKPYVHEYGSYKKPPGAMEKDTTHKLAYRKHEPQHTKSMRPLEAHKPEADFNDATSYRVDYKPWKAKRVEPLMKPVYIPNDAPFDSISTQKAHYIRQPYSMAKSFKPDPALPPGGSFDDGTMYRIEYTPKVILPCPVEMDMSTKYKYEGQDVRGHEYYSEIPTLNIQMPCQQTALPVA